VAGTLDDDRQPLEQTLADRRRPGRVDYQDLRLIALLRGQSPVVDEATQEVHVNLQGLSVARDDDAARGIVIGMSIGAAMWAVIIFALWRFL
jgi:hypothetical protein